MRDHLAEAEEHAYAGRWLEAIRSLIKHAREQEKPIGATPVPDRPLTEEEQAMLFVMKWAQEGSAAIYRNNTHSWAAAKQGHEPIHSDSITDLAKGLGWTP